MARITHKQVAEYATVYPQLTSLLATMQELSKKKPDGPVNKFKLKHANEILENANRVLTDKCRPFKEFLSFDIEGELTTASDVVMILTQ